MESIQQLLASLFGGDVSFFSSLWDIIQGFILFGGGVVAMIYRHRDTVSRAIAKVKTNDVDKITQELSAIKDSNAYLADMVVTLSLASPVLAQRAKEQIALYAQGIKQIKGLELEPVTNDIIKAALNKDVVKTLKEEAEVIVQKTEAITKSIVKQGETVKDIIESIPL
jgi:hypothetical protein